MQRFVIRTADQLIMTPHDLRSTDEVIDYLIMKYHQFDLGGIHTAYCVGTDVPAFTLSCDSFDVVHCTIVDRDAIYSLV